MKQTEATQATMRSEWQRRAPLMALVLGWGVYFWRVFNVPIRVSGDAAQLGLHTLDFLRRDLWPFYIYHMAAPNALIMYLQAPVFSVFGFKLLALRAVPALAGALAFPAVYLACREVFADQGITLARRAGLLAMLGMALSPFFGLFFSIGEEGPLVPVLELMTIAALARGLRRGRWTDFVLAGLVLGASQYAYIVARAFPVALGVSLLVMLVLYRMWGSRIWGLVLTAVVAAGVALPQWVLFVRFPFAFVARTQFSSRSNQFVLAMPNAALALGRQLLNQFLMLGVYWNSSHNSFYYRPLLTPVLFLGFLVAVVALVRFRRASLVFVAILAGIMLLPDLLVVEGWMPSANRLVGVYPFLFMIAGLGCAAIWHWLESRPWLPPQAGWLVLAGVVLAGAESQWYFSRQVAPQVDQVPGREWQASLVEIAETDFIARHPDLPILIPSSEYQRPQMAFLLADYFRERAGGVTSPLVAGESLRVVAPAAPNRPTSSGTPAGYLPDEWVLLKNGTAYFLPPLPGSLVALGATQAITASNGVLAATSFMARWAGATPAITPVSASFANGLDLVGYHATELAPGRPITVTLYWQPRQPVPDDVQLFTQIIDRNENVVAAVHDWPLHGAYRVRAWTPGQIMPLSYRFDIPANAAPGPYRLITGEFDLLQQKRVALVSGGDRAIVGVLKIPLPPGTTAPAQTLDARLGDVIRLQGYTLETTTSGVRVHLFWQALQTPPADFTVFVHLVDAAGNLVAQADAQPWQGQYPTSIWSPGEAVGDTIEVPVAAGEYRVFVGLYQVETLERLGVVVNGESQPDDRLLLGVVKVP
jgi:4-amino-4-deoxy-L-arabinose transferase-like glycosyltransferase